MDRLGQEAKRGIVTIGGYDFMATWKYDACVMSPIYRHMDNNEEFVLSETSPTTVGRLTIFIEKCDEELQKILDANELNDVVCRCGYQEIHSREPVFVSQVSRGSLMVHGNNYDIYMKSLFVTGCADSCFEYDKKYKESKSNEDTI